MEKDETTQATTPGALTDFRFESFVFEVLHPQAFLHWDRAGAIWSEFGRKWPGISPTHVQPAGTQFTVNNRFTLLASVEKMAVADSSPSFSADEVLEKIVNDFIQIVSKRLELSVYYRVAVRQSFFKKYVDRAAAVASFLALGLINIPSGPNFGIDNPPILPECIIRWENEKIGATLRLKVEGRKYAFEPPLGPPILKRQEEEETGIIYDVDYYTVAPISTGQLNAGLWIAQAAQIIKRDGNKILGGI